ncbi:MAG: hypothetical protein AAF449_25400, partial [Myxococcota bacterium]
RSCWLRKLAHWRAEQDAEETPWSATDVYEFGAKQLRKPTTHRELFDATLHALYDLKEWLERGNDSQYQTWARADDEPEMRNLIAGWLNQNAKSRFSCAQENELANSQRPDIWTQIPGASAVPIELKLLDKDWSGRELCERLRNQLAGDYLRDPAADCGVMLLVRQTREKSWFIDEVKVDIRGLRDALLKHWADVSSRFPDVQAIEVVVIDLTIRARASQD